MVDSQSVRKCTTTISISLFDCVSHKHFCFRKNFQLEFLVFTLTLLHPKSPSKSLWIRVLDAKSKWKNPLKTRHQPIDRMPFDERTVNAIKFNAFIVFVRLTNGIEYRTREKNPFNDTFRSHHCNRALFLFLFVYSLVRLFVYSTVSYTIVIVVMNTHGTMSERSMYDTNNSQWTNFFTCERPLCEHEPQHSSVTVTQTQTN